MPLRSGPRNPGHSASGFAPAVVTGEAAAFSETLAVGFSFGADTGAEGPAAGVAPALGAGSGGAGAAVGGGASSSPWATSRSSAFFDHRNERSFLKLAAVKPPVRMSVQNPQATTIVAAIVAQRAPPASRRLATAQTTKAAARGGRARIG
jgi:hypothetical protein